MVDDLNLMFFNLVYTSLPPILYGVFDRCASDEMLMAYPQLYKRGPKNKVHFTYFLSCLTLHIQELWVKPWFAAI